jgi:ribosomal protein S18 acetylase RimI-like enzyme
MQLREMQSLAARVSPATGFRHIGDLAWNFALAPDADTRLWRHHDRVVAWAWLEPPDSAMLQLDPARPELADDVVDWIESRLAGEVRLELARTETALNDAVARRGYTVIDGPFMVSLRRSLTDLPSVGVPAGFRCRAMVPDDADAWVDTHRAAFGGTGLSAARYRQLTTVWPYQPEFCAVVEAPDGQVAAYCQGWFDEINGIGEFEPVGTRPEFRRLGLARAACLEVLHAFATAGGQRAVVYSRGDAAYPVPKLVYESLGFTAFTRTDWFRRELS